MSWDVSIMKFAHRYQSVAEIPADAEPLALGTRSFVHAAISEVFHGVDWSDPRWGVFRCEHGSIEFNNGGEEPLTSVMMHVRAGAAIVPLIVDLCRRQDWSALDLSSGDFLDQVDTPAKGQADWQTYRDRVIGDGEGT